MAGEIYQAFDETATLYALVYRPSDSYIYDVDGAAFEAIGTWNDARAEECDIVMTAAGDFHFADFPSVTAGTYVVQVRNQAGASPDSTDDYIISQGILEWDGAGELLPLSVLSTVHTVIDQTKDPRIKSEIII